MQESLFNMLVIKKQSIVIDAPKLSFSCANNWFYPNVHFALSGFLYLKETKYYFSFSENNTCIDYKETDLLTNQI